MCVLLGPACLTGVCWIQFVSQIFDGLFISLTEYFLVILISLLHVPDFPQKLHLKSSYSRFTRMVCTAANALLNTVSTCLTEQTDGHNIVLQMGSPQQKPKLIKLLCDVSGSMYRFNGQDGRLDRQLETILMVMEAFEGYDHKIKVSGCVQVTLSYTNTQILCECLSRLCSIAVL